MAAYGRWDNKNELENGDPVCVCNNDGHHLESVCMEPIPLFQKAETSNRFGHFFARIVIQ